MKNTPLWLLHDTLTHSTLNNPDKIAVVTETISHTYKELYKDVRQVAVTLKQHGLKNGERVALYLDNTYACVVSLYATLFAGGAFVIINPQTKSEKLCYILKNSGARILFSDVHLFSQILPVSETLAQLSLFVYTGKETDETAKQIHPSALPFSEALSMTYGSNLHDTCVLSNDLAALIYTSGSTGNPKGVMMSHQAMLFAAQSITYYLRLDNTHTIINMLPMAFDYGMYQLLMSMLCGATLILERSFTYPSQIFNLISKNNVTVFPAVPTIYSTIISMHRKRPLCFSSVLRITNTAAALPDNYTDELHQIFPNALIFRMYGLTECKRVSYLEPEFADLKPTSVGKAIPGTETILLSSKGDQCKPDETGILHVRGPHIMMGYWNDPEMSARMLRQGKYPGERMLCTHDWFRMDHDGDLYFVGRSDDIIKSRGEKISPIEVENVLMSFDGIREAAVIGIPDALLGQAVKAFVVVDDSSITEQAIKRHCTERLENFMVPKFYEIIDDLPKTSSGKITKKNLK